MKLARRADTSKLIIWHLKHLKRVAAEMARSFTGAAMGVRDGADAAAHSLANECEAGTRGTPTAVRIQGLMNLSKGK